MIVCLRYKNVTARTRKKNYAGQMKIFWIDMIGEAIKMLEPRISFLHAEVIAHRVHKAHRGGTLVQKAIL